MNDDLFLGKLCRLTAVDPGLMAEAYSKWSQDTEYWRLMASEPCQPMSIKSSRDWLEEELYKDPPGFIMFAIHTLDSDKLIGEVGFEDADLPPGDAYVSIGLGERENWGKGFGTDVLSSVLRYAFTELNMHRVSAIISEYNPRSIQTFINLGFVVEGRLRAAEHRAGHRQDLVFLGILREEWERKQSTNNK